MTDLLLTDYDRLIRERNRYRRELDLYREAFEAMVALVDSAASAEGRAWEYRKTREADRAVRRILRYRARNSENDIAGNGM